MHLLVHDSVAAVAMLSTYGLHDGASQRVWAYETDVDVLGHRFVQTLSLGLAMGRDIDAV